jgi:hypothetical protein
MKSSRQPLPRDSIRRMSIPSKQSRASSTSKKESAVRQTTSIEQNRATVGENSAAARTMAFLSAVGKTLATLHYPINSFDELVSETTGKKISVGKIAINVSALRSLVPAYYFPIASRDNLVEKLTEISRLAGAALAKSDFGKLSIGQEAVFPAPLPVPSRRIAVS